MPPSATPPTDEAAHDADGRPDAPAQIQAALSQVVRWLGRSDVRAALRGTSGEDLSATDLWVLAAIADAEPVRSSALATWQGVDKSTVAGQVRRLADRGLLQRSEDPDDGRAVLLTLTPRGRSTFTALNATRATVFRSLLARWDEEDRARLATLLGRLSDELPGRGRTSVT